MSHQSFMEISGARALARRFQRAELPNISVKYMYRDASNYKSFKIVNFTNPERLNASEIWQKINEVLQSTMLFSGQLLFRPEWVKLPTVFLFAMPENSRNEDDHDWHELHSVKETNCSPTLGESSSINDFIEALKRTHSMII